MLPAIDVWNQADAIKNIFLLFSTGLCWITLKTRVRNVMIDFSLFSISLFCSACQGRDMWSDCCPSLLQQEQDRREISDCQMFLLPWTSCRHHSGHALLRWWYVLLYCIVYLCVFWIHLPEPHLFQEDF